MSTNRLEMHNISLAFSGFQALNKVDFTLHGGSVHALTGANGAGKSTLMAVLCGTHAHYEGEVTINNLPVTIRSPRDAKQLGIHRAAGGGRGAGAGPEHCGKHYAGQAGGAGHDLPLVAGSAAGARGAGAAGRGAGRPALH